MSVNFVKDSMGDIINTDYVCQFYQHVVGDSHKVSAHFIMTPDIKASKILFSGTKPESDAYYAWLQKQLGVEEFKPDGT